jgi:hypothetical protein
MTPRFGRKAAQLEKRLRRKIPSEGEPLKTMKKLGIATALVLTLAFGAGSVFAQNTNSSTTGGTMSAKHSRRHHRRAHHRRHHRAKAANANANT